MALSSITSGFPSYDDLKGDIHVVVLRGDGGLERAWKILNEVYHYHLDSVRVRREGNATDESRNSTLLSQITVASWPYGVLILRCLAV